MCLIVTVQIDYSDYELWRWHI